MSSKTVFYRVVIFGPKIGKLRKLVDKNDFITEVDAIEYAQSIDSSYMAEVIQYVINVKDDTSLIYGKRIWRSDVQAKIQTGEF